MGRFEPCLSCYSPVCEWLRFGGVFTTGGRLTPPPPRGGGRRKREVKLVAPSGVIGIHCVLKSNCGMRITLLIRSAFTSCDAMEGCVVVGL